MNIERLREVFDYDPNSGVLSWKKRTSNRIKVGAAAVCPSGNGYLKVRLDSVLYYAHRVAYAIANGAIPDGAEIDHINGVRNDNRLCNLRLVSPMDNRHNQGLRVDNKSGVNGVYWSKNACKWLATIGVAREQIYLGCFDSFDDAVAARKAAEVQYQFHKNHGKKRG